MEMIALFCIKGPAYSNNITQTLGEIPSFIPPGSSANICISPAPKAE